MANVFVAAFAGTLVAHVVQALVGGYVKRKRMAALGFGGAKKRR